VIRPGAAWARLRAWRRIHFTTAGTVFTAGALAVGFAAINTGNNLLHLVLGAMLGAMGVSGWLSEQTIRGVEVRRSLPRGTPVGRETRIRYRIRNHKRWLPTLALELRERGLPGVAFVPRVRPGGRAEARAVNTFERRGVYPLATLTLSTTFPFGLFRKERDVTLPGELVIWPRSDLPLRQARPGSGRRPRRAELAASAGVGARGDYRGLREYRAGDDPRDIHWRTSARLRSPVVREYERDASETLWICLDLGAPPGEAAEIAVEIAASLAARAAAEGKRSALVAGEGFLPPGLGAGHLEAVLEHLARADFRVGTPPPTPPVDPGACVLVSVTGRGAEPWADVYRPGEA
jgi:uncharacterized protein (DUF58 family)